MLPPQNYIFSPDFSPNSRLVCLSTYLNLSLNFRYLKHNIAKTKVLIPSPSYPLKKICLQSSPTQLVSDFWSFTLKTLVSSLTPLFFSHPASKPSANPVGPTFRMYLESDHYLPTSSPSTLVWATIVSHEDYCHSLLTGPPASTLAQHTGHFLQTSQSDPFRLKSDQATPLLQALQWFPISLQIIELLTIVSRVIHNLVLPASLILCPAMFSLT